MKKTLSERTAQNEMEKIIILFLYSILNLFILMVILALLEASSLMGIDLRMIAYQHGNFTMKPCC